MRENLESTGKNGLAGGPTEYVRSRYLAPEQVNELTKLSNCRFGRVREHHGHEVNQSRSHSSILQYHVGGFLADHDRRGVGVPGWDRRHDRGVRDAQPADAANPQARI
jgi:hypothetical protein